MWDVLFLDSLFVEMIFFSRSHAISGRRIVAISGLLLTMLTCAKSQSVPFRQVPCW